MNTSRRRFISTLVAGGYVSSQSLLPVLAASKLSWHEDIANKARRLATGKPLRVLIPKGSGANILAATNEFTRLSKVSCIIEEVDADQINVELILREAAGDSTIDVALPATYGIIDLVQANAIISLDHFANEHEPTDYADGHLYRKGDSFGGKLYGYQTDGDAYLLFYNKGMLEDPEEIEAYRALTGKPLEPATTWEDLDAMMAFFQRPEQGQYGGCLFRNAAYLVWEWWARFHAKGGLPFSADMQVNINNQAGVEALEELIAASASLSPGARVNSFVDNWAEFAGGNIFCNLGWGGTQKYLMNTATMRNNMVHGALPGPPLNGLTTTLGYVNWGWNYTVGTQSNQPELAYLLALFCATPKVSTLAIRESRGFFDPFYEQHYEDPEIIDVYGAPFLKAHRENMQNAIPDLYLSGQGQYLDALRLQIVAAINADLSASDALNGCARTWSLITRRLGKQKQMQQWQRLLTTYPDSFRQLNKGG